MRQNPWKSVSMLLLGIVVGCAASAVSGETQTASAAPRPAVWEHNCMGPSGSVDGVNDDVRKAGSEGWELVTMADGVVCFKRPVASLAAG